MNEANEVAADERVPLEHRRPAVARRRLPAARLLVVEDNARKYQLPPLPCGQVYVRLLIVMGLAGNPATRTWPRSR
jgi:hypothetical protein